ncbi:MAG: hypothetical protein ACRYGG_23745, partial [Janthinobacterium lividum]
AFVNDEPITKLHCRYDVKKAPRGGFGLHITKPLTSRIEVGDIINIFAGDRDILTSGGKVTEVFTCKAGEIKLDEFQWWNFVGSHTLSTLLTVIDVQATSIVTGILYRSLEQ